MTHLPNTPGNEHTDTLDALLASPVRMGFVAQGHVPTIETMLLAGESWVSIGQEIGWDAATVAQHYAVYAVQRIRELEAGALQPSSTQREAVQFRIDVDCVRQPGFPFAAVVFSTGYRNPLNAYAELERTLTAQGVEGEVLFDLLAANGSDAQNARYVSCLLRKGRFERDWGRPKTPAELGCDYRAYCDAFYRKNRAAMDFSLLPDELKASFQP